MNSDRQLRSRYLGILRANQGFEHPEEWVEYAARHGFRKVEATPIDQCPSCGGGDTAIVGQYLYYSNLFRLRRCIRCDLFYSDLRLDPAVTARHFEHAYKDEGYFTHHRARTFHQIRRLVLDRAAIGDRVIDIGGAKGHLARILADAGYDVTVADISETACRHAETQLGLRAVPCGLEDLKILRERFQVVLVIDALYYVTDLRAAWESLDHVVTDRGTLVLRLPNRFWALEEREDWRRLARNGSMQSAIPGFNPEHRYYFTNRYLRRQLEQLGFKRVELFPAAPESTSAMLRNTIAQGWYVGAQALNALTFQKVVVSPSKLVVATR